MLLTPTLMAVLGSVILLKVGLIGPAKTLTLCKLWPPPPEKGIGAVCPTFVCRAERQFWLSVAPSSQGIRSSAGNWNIFDYLEAIGRSVLSSEFWDQVAPVWLNTGEVKNLVKHSLHREFSKCFFIQRENNTQGRKDNGKFNDQLCGTQITTVWAGILQLF